MKEQILRKRAIALKNLKVQAEKMKKKSDAKLSSVSVGENVLIPIPDVDRARTDLRNVIAIVMENNNGFYKLGTPHGILNSLYSRSQFTPCTADFFPLADMLHVEKSLREIARNVSVTGGQAFQKCNCRQQCKTNRCSCSAKQSSAIPAVIIVNHAPTNR